MRIKKGCGKLLYRNDIGKVKCGDYLSGGIMLCLECQNYYNHKLIKNKNDEVKE